MNTDKHGLVWNPAGGQFTVVNWEGAWKAPAVSQSRQFFGLRRQPAEAKRSEDWSAAATALSEFGGRVNIRKPSPKAAWRFASRRSPKPGGSSDGSWKGRLKAELRAVSALMSVHLCPSVLIRG
jgi:hypothetical protein